MEVSLVPGKLRNIEGYENNQTDFAQQTRIPAWVLARPGCAIDAVFKFHIPR